jgi:hypothetical protein
VVVVVFIIGKCNFFLGFFVLSFWQGAKTRTAQQRFELLNKQSTLEDLKTAFAVEGLSQEFYQKPSYAKPLGFVRVWCWV